MKAIMYIILSTELIVILTGCGPILGMQEMDAWGFKAKFKPGLDFGISANAIDRVDNRRSTNQSNPAPTN